MGQRRDDHPMPSGRAFQLFVRGQAGTLTVDGVSAGDDVAALVAAVAAKAHVPTPAAPAAPTAAKEPPAFKWTNGKISRNYTVGKEELGSGSFAVVKRCKKKGADGGEFAVKIIDKAKVDDMNDLTREVEIMSGISHPNIVRLYEVFDEPKTMHLVVELLEGGELFDRVVEQGHYSEKDAARTLATLSDALAYIHARDIVHRDLKPENILLASEAPDAPIKLTDFGFARTMAGGGDLMKTACGTPGYVAPEVLKNQGYSSGAVDMWSTGVILYVLLCGFPPFAEEELPDLFASIMEGKYDFPSPWWDDVSPEAKACVSALLTVDPEKRLKAADVAAHPWVVKMMGSSAAAAAPLKMVSDSLKKYQSTRSVKKLTSDAVHL